VLNSDEKSGAGSSVDGYIATETDDVGPLFEWYSGCW
jgi:hypothetical protein